MNRKNLFWTVICLSIAFVLTGCAASSSSTKTQTITTESAQEGYAQQGNRGNFAGGESSPAVEGPATTKIEKRTEVKEKHSVGGSGGVLSTTLHLIGQVLAFPFKVIAGVIELVF
jgi:hypothetical protein